MVLSPNRTDQASCTNANRQASESPNRRAGSRPLPWFSDDLPNILHLKKVNYGIIIPHITRIFRKTYHNYTMDNYLTSLIYFIFILPSGERLHSNGKIHHAINGKIHYFDWAMFNSKLLVHQRVPCFFFNEKLAMIFRHFLNHWIWRFLRVVQGITSLAQWFPENGCNWPPYVMIRLRAFNMLCIGCNLLFIYRLLLMNKMNAHVWFFQYFSMTFHGGWREYLINSLGSPLVQRFGFCGFI